MSIFTKNPKGDKVTWAHFDGPKEEAEWIVRNNYQGNYIVVDDDVSDIVFYKDLEKRLVKTSYYKRYDGFRFLHFLKGLRLLLWGVK